MGYQIRFYGRVHPEQAGVRFPEIGIRARLPKESEDDSIWQIFCHGSQLLISAEFMESDTPPSIRAMREKAQGISSLIVDWIGFQAVRVYEVEILAADDGNTRWVFGADVDGVTTAKDFFDGDLSIFYTLPPRALGMLQSALEDFRLALRRSARAPMYIHRMLETLAWYYAPDDDQKSLTTGDWNTLWEHIGLGDSEEREWANSTVKQAALKLRHGRPSDVKPDFSKVIALGRTALSAFIRAEIIEGRPEL